MMKISFVFLAIACLVTAALVVWAIPNKRASSPPPLSSAGSQVAANTMLIGSDGTSDPSNASRVNYERNMGLINAIAVRERQRYQDRSDALFEQFQDEYQKELAGWVFEVARWGDYLNINIARGARTRSVSMLISTLTPAEVAPGHPPDHGLTLRGNWSPIGTDGSKPSGFMATGVSSEGGSYNWEPQQSWYFGNNKSVSVNTALPEGFSWIIGPNYPSIPKERPFLSLPSYSNQHASVAYGTSSTITWSGMSNGVVPPSWTPGSPEAEVDSGGSQELMKGFARPAHDDRIDFSIAGASIYVPAGRGRAILEQIMNATATRSTSEQ